MQVKSASETPITDLEIGWRRLSWAHAHVTAALERVLSRDHHLRVSEYHTLTELAEAAQNRLRIQDLADLLGMTQSSVSRIIARLEEDGLCERCVCPNDRRGVFARLKKDGRRKLDQASSAYRATLVTECHRLGISLRDFGEISQVPLSS